MLGRLAIQGALPRRCGLRVLYTLFHLWLNIAAELICFGDREFDLKLAKLTVPKASYLSKSVQQRMQQGVEVHSVLVEVCTQRM